LDTEDVDPDTIQKSLLELLSPFDTKNIDPDEFRKSFLELCNAPHSSADTAPFVPPNYVHVEFELNHTTGMSRHSSVSSLNEQSPLISPQVQAERTIDSDVEDSRLSESLTYDVTSVESKSSWYLFLLVLSIGGLQIVWSVEFSNGSPYLLSLGMSKSLLAFVWIAGPLSGALVQPYIGIRSDNCRISWGKRKPFMIAGGGATIVALLALAWTREMVGGFLGLFGAASDSHGVKVTAIVVAILFMYLLDFAINTGKMQFPSC
jgi:hypothetical protein